MITPLLKFRNGCMARRTAVGSVADIVVVNNATIRVNMVANMVICADLCFCRAAVRDDSGMIALATTTQIGVLVG